MKESKKIGRPKVKRTRLAIPDDAYRKISRISEESRMPMQLVYEDALLNGIVTLKEMYSSATEFRRTRDEMIHERDPRVVQERKFVRSERTEPGEPSEPAYTPESADFQEEPAANGSGNVAIERGFSPEDAADLESDLGYERGE